ncbi:unnamed protein product, partial [Nesidiocoris tenuis]
AKNATGPTTSCAPTAAASAKPTFAIRNATAPPSTAPNASTKLIVRNFTTTTTVIFQKIIF